MKFLISILLISNLFGVSFSQKNVLKTTYKVASWFSAKDGHIFNDTMVAIVLRESSGGRQLIGDSYINGVEKPFIMKSLGVGQVKLETAIHMIMAHKDIYKNFQVYIHKNPFAFKKYYKYLIKIEYYQDILRRYKNKNDARSIRVKKWANKELRYYEKLFRPYKEYYKKDLELAQLLLSDIEFNVSVGTLYLIQNYEIALKRHYSNPWFRAISRYNGGWNNKTYYKKVLEKMKIWRKIKNQISK